jgi:hypothetical protein
MLKGIRKAGFKKAAVMGLIISVLMMGVGYGYLSRTIFQYKRTLLEKKQELNRLEPDIAAREARVLFRNNLALLKKIDDHTHWAEALRELSIIVPPQMAFQSLRFKREKGRINISIKGAVVAPQALAGREIFSRFYSRLGSSPLFANVDAEPAGTRVMRPEKNDKSSSVRIEFEVKGELAPVEIEYEAP